MSLRPTRMEVKLDNVRYNYRLIKKHIGGERIIAVLKANAYNLGALPVAWALCQEGADFFAVATPDEALELREGGITFPILVLGSSPYEAASEYVKWGIRPAITDLNMARALSNAAVKLKKTAFVHLKVDTGLGRIGFFPDEVLDAAERISSMEGVVLEGIFTHFATADSGDLAWTRKQYEKFIDVINKLAQKGIKPKLRHCCNSAATLEAPEMTLDAVRPGHIIMGMYPSPEVKRSILIKPCFEFKTAIGALRELPPGTGVSYGLDYVTRGVEKIAILPLGYADGYYRELWAKGTEVLIRGKRCPVVGRICMDQMMVNVTHLEDVSVGDEVVLIGKQGGDEITLDEIAQKLGTLTCVPPTLISTKRVPRVYMTENS